MKIRLLIALFSISTLLFFVGWKTVDASGKTSSSLTMLQKKKIKRKKKKKTSPKKKSTEKEKKPPSPRDSAQVKKREAKREKNLNKLLSKKGKEMKKSDKKTAEIEKEAKKPYDKCDSTKLVRTSSDSAILVKYIRIYRTLGGVCYIMHLQEMAKLHEDTVGVYTVHIEPSKDPRAAEAWQTYLYCPIGKPNGEVLLLSPTGDTVQVAFYMNEKKTGLMSWFKKGKGIIYQEKYANDEKVWERKEE